MNNKDVDDERRNSMNQTPETRRDKKILHDDDFSEDLEAEENTKKAEAMGRRTGSKKKSSASGTVLHIIAWIALVIGWFVPVGPDIFIWGAGAVMAYMAEKRGSGIAKIAKWLNIVSLIYIVVQIIRVFMMVI